LQEYSEGLFFITESDITEHRHKLKYCRGSGSALCGAKSGVLEPNQLGLGMGAV